MRGPISHNITAFLRLMTWLLFLPCFLLMEPNLPLEVYYISVFILVYAILLYTFPLVLQYLNLIFPISLLLDLFLITVFLFFLNRYTFVLAFLYLPSIIVASFNPKQPAAPYGVVILVGIFYIVLAILRGYSLVPISLQIISFLIIAFCIATMAQQCRQSYAQQANQDSLTKINNRRFFQMYLHKLVANHTPFTLILIDIDNFKQLNDTQGHHHGDYVLKLVASILKEFSRSSDIVSRYGGDEFAIILPYSSLEESKCLAEKIRNSVLVNPKLLPYPIISVSLGIAAYPTDAPNVEDLLVKADSALYKAKGMGKNYVYIYEESRDCP